MTKTNTYQHESMWPALQTAAETRGAQAIIATIQATSDDYERLSLFRFTIRGLMFREWNGKNLDTLASVADAAIQDTLASMARNPADKTWFKDQANILCYNMSSNLADCWGDGIARDERHFHSGLRFAEQALIFRQELGKGPFPFYLAYWVKGIHELLLGRTSESLRSFEKSSAFASESAKSQDKPTQLVPGAPFEVILAAGYLAIARMVGERSSVVATEARATYDEVIRAFESMKGQSKEASEDAEIGLSQLKFTRQRLGMS